MARQDYSNSGFNQFFSRSIGGSRSDSLRTLASNATQGNSREVNYDNSPTTGSLGSKIQVGKSIVLDGNNERISVFDGSTETIRIGELGD